MAQETIVKIVIALIILGITGTLLYLGIGPFRNSVKYNACKGEVLSWCASHQQPDGKYACSSSSSDFPSCASAVTPTIVCDENTCIK